VGGRSSAKLSAADEVTVVEALQWKSRETKEMVKILKTLPWKGKRSAYRAFGQGRDGHPLLQGYPGEGHKG